MVMSFLFGEKPTNLSMGVHIPGFLKWGDISLVAALSCADLEIINVLKMDGSVYAGDDVKILQEEIMLLKKKCRISEGSVLIR